MERKSFLATEVLCLLLGWLGVHRYYTGYIGLGVAQTLTLGGCGIWSLIDFIFISLGKYRDANGQELEDYDKNIGIGALILLLALALFSTFDPKKSPDKTVINNNSSSFSTTENRGMKVKFSNAECTVDANGYAGCVGYLSESDELKHKKIQNMRKSELK